ncbi:MAG TPA: ABC transporter ATP-binding protein [Thermodesulfobacteriota bacterium]|nr:ABC transporter ATP-binding protein [Thermodesulfobacteriota bacterium]
MTLLEVQNLMSGYKKVTVLHGISFQVEGKEILAVVGSNGAGKTTLLKTISGLLHPFSGEIVLEGMPIQGLEPHQVVERGIVQVPEGRQLFSYMSVVQNLQVGSHIQEARSRRQDTLKMIFTLFPVLEERQQQMAGTLSGGEQQMLATARALMARPKLLMMDEPSWGLAPFLVRRLFETICQINQQGCTILLVEQHVHQALSIATRGYVLERGNMVMQGGGKELLKDERLKESYLGM